MTMTQAAPVSNGVVEQQKEKVAELVKSQAELEKEYLEYCKEEFKSFQGADNYNRIADQVVPVYANTEKLICEMVVQRQHVNTKGTLHGGQTASLIDIVTARAVGVTVKDKGMASIELSVSYLLPIKLGDEIQLIATVLKCGRNVAFTECEFRRKDNGKLCAKGKHTLALLPGSPPVVNGKLAQF